jgi:hypothetical protein
MERKIALRFPSDITSQAALILFIDAVKKGNIQQEKSNIPNNSRTVVSVNQNNSNVVKMPAKIDIVNTLDVAVLKNIPNTNVQYKEDNKKLLIMYGKTEILTTWDEIVKLSGNSYGKARDNVKKSRSDLNTDDREILLIFMDAYRNGKIIDPDAGFRPMLHQNTGTTYDGSKLEGTLED